MSRTVLIEQGADLIEAVRETVLAGGTDLERALVVFPGQRPGFFLRRALAVSLGRTFIPPAMFAMDEWIDDSCLRIGHRTRKLAPIDAVGVLYDLQRQRGLPGTAERTLPLETFLPWGFKLYADFEELAIEEIAADALKGVQALIEEDLPERVRGAMSDLASLYERFCVTLERQHWSTRSARYRHVSRADPDLVWGPYDRILLAGFVALTRSEARIFGSALRRDNVTLLLQNGPGIERLLGGLGVEPEQLSSGGRTPKITFHKATDAHGEILKLSALLSPAEYPEAQVIVVPEPSTLFPLVQHALGILGEDWNISLGYPLTRTALFTLFEALARALESREGERYHVSDYLRLVLHPYVKNLALEGASYPTRVLLHAIESSLATRRARYITLSDLETDRIVLRKVLEQFRGLGRTDVGEEPLVAHLKAIHDVTVRGFDRVATIRDFGEYILRLVSHISRHSSANYHPYAPEFFRALIEGIDELLTSPIAEERFEEPRAAFSLLRSYVQTLSVPFHGTPLRGVQVLGSLETRNLRFDRVYFLDANEGVVPHRGKEDSILPLGVRNALKLPTYQDRERIARYHFENLVRGAEEVHLFYREGEADERSRFIERLIWEEQRRTGDLERPPQEVVHFRGLFSQRDPEAIAKSREMVTFLRAQPVSATRLDTYLRCPLQFYHRYVLGLQEREGVEDQVEPLEVGSLVHEILAEFFRARTGRALEILPGDGETISRITERVFEGAFSSPGEGNLYLLRRQLDRRMGDLLEEHRLNRRGVVILDCEREFQAALDVPGVGLVQGRGKMDRIERRGSDIVILDYKTGSTKNAPRPSFRLEVREEWPRTLGSVQLPFYVMLYLLNTPRMDVGHVNSGLLLLGTPGISEVLLFAADEDRTAALDRYRKAIFTLISEILDPAVPFEASPDPSVICRTCVYQVMCGRQWAGRGRG
jgi:CRISPR/Cas system-associated exonuclease Cas4 (RecB family)